MSKYDHRITLEQILEFIAEVMTARRLMRKTQ
jgi:hypothetical protein